MEAGLAIGADLDADAVALDLAAGLRAGALRAGALRAAGAFFLVAFLVAAIKESPGCVCVSAAQNQTTAVALQAHNEPTRNRSSVRAALAVETAPFAPPIAVSADRIAVAGAAGSLLRLGPFWLVAQIFVEPVERALPRLFGGRFVVARGRIVVKAVIGAFVDVPLMRHVGFAERLVEGRPAARDTLVELAILRVDRRLDLGRVLGLWLRAVERHAGVEVAAHPHRQLIDDAAAIAEPDRAQFAGRIRPLLQPCRGGLEVFHHLAAVELAKHLRRLFLIAGVAAGGGQLIRREGNKVRDREPPRDVLDVRVEPAILVHDENHRLL